MPRRKKQKLEVMEADESVGRDVISTLPLELIADILLRTSPKEVLALARCSRHFCHFLTSPQADYIWKLTRKIYKPPVPDPTPNFTESAYAAYVFDGGPCEHCGKYIDGPYLFFSLRLRLCNFNYGCQKGWTRKHAYILQTPADNPIRWRILEAEGDWSIKNKGVKGDVCRKRDYIQAVLDHEKMCNNNPDKDLHNEVSNQIPRALRIKAEIDELSKNLRKWRKYRGEFVKKLHWHNTAEAKRFARSKGWTFYRLRTTPTYLTTVKGKEHFDEQLVIEDFESIVTDVVAEMKTTEEKQLRAKKEADNLQKRAIVAAFYHTYKYIQNAARAPTPSLATYRELPTIETLVKDDTLTPDALRMKLKDKPTGESIKADTQLWIEKVVTSFVEKVPDARLPRRAKRSFNPFDKVTALFNCTRCAKNSPEKLPIPLTMRNACQHDCPHLKNKQRKKQPWAADHFELDVKAANLAREFLSYANLSESTSTFENIPSDDRILCKSCDGFIHLNFRTMIQHCHRHDDMLIEVLAGPPIEDRNYIPVEWGLVALLTSKQKSWVRRQSQCVYGCRHCVSDRKAVESVSSTKSAKLMTFHGLRCHLSQRHGIKQVLDEDVYMVKGDSSGSMEASTEEDRSLLRNVV